MTGWQTRCGKRKCRSDDRDPPLRRDPCHGCVRVRYQTMAITGRGNRERQLATHSRHTTDPVHRRHGSISGRRRNIAGSLERKTPPDTQSSGVNIYLAGLLPTRGFRAGRRRKVIHRVIAFDEAGLQDGGEPPHHQVSGVCLSLVAKRRRAFLGAARASRRQTGKSHSNPDPFTGIDQATILR